MLKTKDIATVSQATLPKKPAYKKTPSPAPPDAGGAALAAKVYTKSDMYEDIASGISTTAKAMPSHGSASQALKAATAGFATGMRVSAALAKFKGQRQGGKKKKKKGSPETVSQVATTPKVEKDSV